MEHGELRPPLVVVVGRVPDLDAVAVGLDLEPLEVGVELVAGHRRGPGDEEVDPERRRGELAELADLGPDGGRGLVAGGQEPEAPGVADRGRQLRASRARRRAAPE